MQEREWVKYCVLLIASAFLYTGGQAQPTASLSTKTEIVEIGRPFSFEMEIMHPSDMVVIFPDSSMGDLFPYELFSNQAIPTQTDDETGLSTDRTLYQIYTWEVDSLQSLRLPFHYIVNGDTLTAYSNTLKFVLDQKIPQVTDSTKVQFIEGLAVVDEPTNVARVLAWICIVVFVLTMAFILLRGPVAKRIQRWKVEKEWKKYSARLEKYRNKTAQKEEFLEGVNAAWKDYFDRNYDFALRSLTTDELGQLMPGENINLPDDELRFLVNSSRMNDQYIYAGIDVDETELKEIFSEVSQAMLSEYARRKGGSIHD